MPAQVGLGTDFLRLQFAQAVSLMADNSVLWVLMWWLIMTRKDATTEEALSLIGAGLVVYVITLLPAGTLADRVERKWIVCGALTMRALVHLAIALLLVTGHLSVGIGVLCQFLVSMAGAFFDATATAMIPRIVPPSEVRRALDYSLALPRACFYLTSFVNVLLLSFGGETIVCWLGFFFLTVAALLTASIQHPTVPAQTPKREPSTRRRSLIEGLMTMLRSPRLLWLACLPMFANFVLYPLFWLGPASMAPGGEQLPKVFPDNIEVVLVAGVVIGAFATPLLCRRFAAERIAALGLVAMAVALVLLGWLQDNALLYATSTILGFAFVQITGLTGGTATLAVPDALRARVNALCVVLFELGGEAGEAMLRPLIQDYGLGIVLSVLAIVLVLLAAPWMTTPRNRLPEWLRFYE